MKKILYTLLLCVLVVSCQKEEYGGDFAPSALSNDEEISKHDKAFEFINNLVLSTDILVSTKGIPSTEKPGDDGANWLQIIFFEYNGTHLAFLRSDDQGAACPNGADNVDDVVYTLTDTQLIINTNGTAIAYNVPVDTYTATFAQNGPDTVVIVNSERTAAAAGSTNVVVTHS